MHDVEIRETLERLVPEPTDTGDWERVVRTAGTSPRRGRWLLRLAPTAVVLAAVAGAALLWPFGSADRGTVLERALAAVGDGPVLHVVFRGGWGGTLVHLDTGDRRPVHAETEVWYDPERKLARTISRLGGAAEHDEVASWKEPPGDYEALARDYREALRTGRARVAGEDAVDGIPVYWITWNRELNLDVADDRLHEWQQQVAISRDTFEPVAMRETLDGKPGPGTGRRVLELETLSADEADFTASPQLDLHGRSFKGGEQPIELAQAEATLGRTPYWLGDDHDGLPLARVTRTLTAIGRRQTVELRGREAADARQCLDDLRESHGRRRPQARPEACKRVRGVARRHGRVYTFGSVVWEGEQAGLTLFYGQLGDDPATYREDSVPLVNERHVSIAQTDGRLPSPWHRAPVRYVPPRGWILLTAPRGGYLVFDGLRVTIQASSEELVLSAARALRPMPT